MAEYTLTMNQMFGAIINGTLTLPDGTTVICDSTEEPMDPAEALALAQKQPGRRVRLGDHFLVFPPMWRVSKVVWGFLGGEIATVEIRDDGTAWFKWRNSENWHDCAAEGLWPIGNLIKFVMRRTPGRKQVEPRPLNWLHTA